MRELRSLEDGTRIKVIETDTETVIELNGYESLRGFWKAALKPSFSEQSLMVGKVGDAVKIISGMGGKISGSLAFDEGEYYAGETYFTTPRVSVIQNEITLGSEIHEEIPHKWSVEFRFKIKFEKGIRFDIVRLQTAIDRLIDAVKVIPWA